MLGLGAIFVFKNINNGDFSIHEYKEISTFYYTMLFPPVLHNLLLTHYLLQHIHLSFIGNCVAQGGGGQHRIRKS